MASAKKLKAIKFILVAMLILLLTTSAIILFLFLMTPDVSDFKN